MIYYLFLEKKSGMMKKLNLCNFLINQRKESNNNMTMTQKNEARSSRQMFFLSRQTSRAQLHHEKYESYHDVVLLLLPFNTCRELGVQLNNTVNFFSYFYCFKLTAIDNKQFYDS